jgi:bifunctional DNA-binding transcriptional regulator/antitoxin component of YhaV-PrlF toxin-antitoxin module
LSKGFVSRVDDQGRVVIPSKIRNVFSTNDHDFLATFVEERDGKRVLILKKYYLGCIFCNENEFKYEDCITFKGHLICRKCLDELLSE